MATSKGKVVKGKTQAGPSKVAAKGKSATLARTTSAAATASTTTASKSLPPAAALRQWQAIAPRLKLSRSGTFFRLQKQLKDEDVESALRLSASSVVVMPPQVADALGIHHTLAASGFLETRRKSEHQTSTGEKITVFLSKYVQPALTESTLASGSIFKEASYPHAVILEGFIPDSAGKLKQGYLFASRDGLKLEPMALAGVTTLADAHFLNPFVPTTTSGPNSTRIEELSMRQISGATAGLRRKTVEAHDVSTAISSLGLHQNVPGTMRVRQPLSRGLGSAVYVSPQKMSVRVGSSRVTEAKLIQWFMNCVVALEAEANATSVSNQLLAQMAKRTAMKMLVPATFQLDFTVMKDAGFVDAAKWEAGKSPGAIQSDDELLAAFDMPIDLKPASASTKSAISATGDLFEGDIPSTPSQKLVLEVCTNVCRLHSINGDCLGQINEQNGTSLFIEFVNQHNAMRVTFNGAKALYSADGAYVSGDLDVAVDQLISFLISTKSLNGVTSEKGSPKAGFKEFPTNSSFRAIEDSPELSNPLSTLICGDANDEIFDYLEISSANRRTRWFHAKMTSGKNPNSSGSLSASALQEAVGQAQKNLAFIRMSQADSRFVEEANRWRGDCTLPVKSATPRIRRVEKDHNGTSIDPAKALGALMADPRTTHEVAILIPGYEIERLEKHLRLIPSGTAPQYVEQLFWLLSAFVHSCLEVGARPLIIMRAKP